MLAKTFLHQFSCAKTRKGEHYKLGNHHNQENTLASLLPWPFQLKRGWSRLVSGDEATLTLAIHDLPFSGVLDEGLVVGDGGHQGWQIGENLLIDSRKFTDKFCKLLYDMFTLQRENNQASTQSMLLLNIISVLANEQWVTKIMYMWRTESRVTIMQKSCVTNTRIQLFGLRNTESLGTRLSDFIASAKVIAITMHTKQSFRLRSIAQGHLL